MAKNKKSFVMYTDWKETFNALSNEKAGELIKHIFSYVSDENPISKDMIINAVFPNIKNALKRDLEKWERQQIQRVEAGKRSAELRKQNATKANERSTKSNERSISSTVNGNVNVNDNVINNKLLSEIKISDLDPSLQEYAQIAKAFQELFIKNIKRTKGNTHHQDKAKFKSYVEPVRKLIEIDKYTVKQLLSIYHYLESDRGRFWWSNILSTTKLREHAQKLSIQASEPIKAKSNNQNNGVRL